MLLIQYAIIDKDGRVIPNMSLSYNFVSCGVLPHNFVNMFYRDIVQSLESMIHLSKDIKIKYGN